MNRLTLCTIVKNEDAMLADCLASVKGVVDDMIVVDTGSTDRTIEIAEAAGARVVHHTWNNDFAAARNAAIAEVTDGYVLILDADERLSSEAGSIIKQAVQDGEIDGARLPLHNANAVDATEQAVLDGSARIGSPLLLERLLRRTPDLAWEGVVHEHVTKWALKGRKIVTLQAPIVHYGAVPELRASLGKADRNIELLKSACQSEPNNAVYRTYLGHELTIAGQVDEARKHIDAAWKVISKLHKQGKPTPNSIPTATVRSMLLLNEGRYKEAQSTVAQARKWDGEHPNLLYFSAQIACATWRRDDDSKANAAILEAAAKDCQRALKLDNEAFQASILQGATSWIAATQLGIIRILQNRPEQAIDAFELATQSKPHHVEAHLGFAEALILGGQAATALEQLTSMLHPNLPDAWILAAWAGFQFGGYTEVAPMILQARQIMEGKALLGEHRSWILEQLEAEAPGEVAA